MIEFAFYFSAYSFVAFGVAFIAVIWLSLICCCAEFLFRIADKKS